MSLAPEGGWPEDVSRVVLGERRHAEARAKYDSAVAAPHAIPGWPGSLETLRADVAKALGTPDFPRVRVGIGRPPGRQDPADWVLDPFSASERTQLPLVIGDAADAVEQLIGEGLLAAQQTHHAPRA